MICNKLYSIIFYSVHKPSMSLVLCPSVKRTEWAPLFPSERHGTVPVLMPSRRLDNDTSPEPPPVPKEKEKAREKGNERKRKEITNTHVQHYCLSEDKEWCQRDSLYNRQSITGAEAPGPPVPDHGTNNCARWSEQLHMWVGISQSISFLSSTARIYIQKESMSTQKSSAQFPHSEPRGFFHQSANSLTTNNKDPQVRIEHASQSLTRDDTIFNRNVRYIIVNT